MIKKNNRNKQGRKGSRLLPVVAIILILLICAGGAAVWFFTEQPTGEMLIPYTNSVESAVLQYQNDSEPMAFASDLAVIPDESVYYDQEITAGATLILDADTLDVLYSENAFDERACASTTKLMTLLVALRYGNMEDEVTVTNEALDPLEGTGSSTAKLQVGDTLTMQQLMYAMMLPSGNDAANVVAIHMSGSIAEFCDLMNETAYEIGAVHSHFTSPHGLDADGHYSTAYDMYVIIHELLKDPRFLEITGTVSYTADYTDKDGAAVSRTWSNTNEYILGSKISPSGVTVEGGKTGTDTNAGYCITCVAQGRSEDTYIAVVFGAETDALRYVNMTNLLSKINN